MRLTTKKPRGLDVALTKHKHDLQRYQDALKKIAQEIWYFGHVTPGTVAGTEKLAQNARLAIELSASLIEELVDAYSNV